MILVETLRQGLAAEFKRPHPRIRGIGVNYLADFLKVMQTERRANEMYRVAPWRYKKSMLVALSWCMDRELIEKRIQFKSSFKNRKDPKVFYKATERGIELLRMIR